MGTQARRAKRRLLFSLLLLGLFHAGTEAHATAGRTTPGIRFISSETGWVIHGAVEIATDEVVVTTSADRDWTVPAPAPAPALQKGRGGALCAPSTSRTSLASVPDAAVEEQPTERRVLRGAPAESIVPKQARALSSSGARAPPPSASTAKPHLDDDDTNGGSR